MAEKVFQSASFPIVFIFTFAAYRLNTRKLVGQSDKNEQQSIETLGVIESESISREIERERIQKMALFICLKLHM